LLAIAIPRARGRIALNTRKISMKFSASTTLLLASLLTSLALAADAPPNGVLLITHLDNHQWQLRLVPSGSGQRFSGVIDSSSPFTAVAGGTTENAGGVRLWTPSSLGATLSSAPGATDSVRFSVNDDAQLCLRDTGSSGVQLYMGENLSNAQRVKAPLALTGEEACGAAASAAPNVGNRKYHPGHYIALLRGWDTQLVMSQSMKPGVVGFMKRYSWPALEPKPGAYQFAEIKSDLAWCAAHGMRLIIMIEDKTFVRELPTPPDLNAYALRNRGGGYTAVRWAPVVLTRFKALLSAIGKQFDSSPGLEGLATQETAPGFPYTVDIANGYTAAKYRDMYIDVLTTVSKAFPTSRIFWFMNFFPIKQEYIANVAAAVAPLGVFMGGPDVMPDNPNLERKTYPFYTQFQSKMVLFAQVEGICYAQPHLTSGYATKYWTMPELFNFAKTNLHVRYMFWVHVPDPAVPGAYDWTDAWPVIAAHPTINP